MRRALGGPRTKSATSGLARGWPLEAPAKAWRAGVWLASVWLLSCVPVCLWSGLASSRAARPAHHPHPRIPSCWVVGGLSSRPPGPTIGRCWAVSRAKWDVCGLSRRDEHHLDTRAADPRRAGHCVQCVLPTSWAELQSTRNPNSSSRVQPGGCDSENEHHRKLACKRAGIHHGGAIVNDAISPPSHEAQARFCCHLPGPATHALQHPRAGLANGGSPIVVLRTAFGRPRRAARRQALGLPWPGSSRDSSTKKRTGQRQQSTLFTPSRPDPA